MGILQTEPEGEVRISLPTGYSAVEPMKRTVQTLRSCYPKIRLILNENNRLVDLQNDTDIAIRVVLHPDDHDSISRPLAQWQTLICASPDYLHKLPSSTLYATTAHRTQSAKVRTVLDCLMSCFGEEKD